MARQVMIQHTCEECGTQDNTTVENARYISDDEIPQGWGFITISLNEEETCKCKCHDEVMDDDGDNVVGHEDYDCEVCPEDDDERWVATLCNRCIRKAMATLKLPKRKEEAL